MDNFIYVGILLSVGAVLIKYGLDIMYDMSSWGGLETQLKKSISVNIQFKAVRKRRKYKIQIIGHKDGFDRCILFEKVVNAWEYNENNIKNKISKEFGLKYKDRYDLYFHIAKKFTNYKES